MLERHYSSLIITWEDPVGVPISNFTMKMESGWSISFHKPKLERPVRPGLWKTFVLISEIHVHPSGHMHTHEYELPQNIWWYLSSCAAGMHSHDGTFELRICHSLADKGHSDTVHIAWINREYVVDVTNASILQLNLSIRLPFTMDITMEKARYTLPNTLACQIHAIRFVWFNIRSCVD